MILLKYNEYITEKIAYDLLLESKVVFSTKFISLLSKMKTNRIASELLSTYSKDINITHNYIDITDEKDAVSFTPDRKVKEIIKDKPETWKVIDSQRFLTHGSANDRLFKALEYEKPSGEPWSPEHGEIGLVLKETISNSSGRVYIVFQEYGVDNPRKTVLNKEAIEPTDADDSRIWTTSRNNIKVGRLVRAILKASDIKFIDKEIEEFTNQYKATYDFAQDALKQFDVVKGKEIARWYDNSGEDTYTDGGGTLNNSCMAEVDTDYFDIYCFNKQVSLVILYDDDGEIKDGRYVSKMIKGRALLWDAKIDGQSANFMDRIYTTHDSDVELFKQFAEKNGWWYKKSQSMSPNESITDGSTTKSSTITIKLDDGDWDYYPYMDTVCYLDTETDTLTNDEDSLEDKDFRVFRDTEGSYTEGN